MSYIPLKTNYLLSVTGDTTTIIPAGYSILQIIIQETAGNSITGGVRIGSTNGGVDIVLSLAVGANSIQYINDATILKRIFSLSIDTTIYIQTITLWNNANVNIYITLSKIN